MTYAVSSKAPRGAKTASHFVRYEVYYIIGLALVVWSLWYLIQS